MIPENERSPLAGGPQKEHQMIRGHHNGCRPVRKRATAAELSQAFFRALHFAKLPPVAKFAELPIPANAGRFHHAIEPLAPLKPLTPTSPIDWTLPTRRAA